MSAREHALSQPLTWRRLLIGVVLLAALTAILQGRSIFHGLMLDDFNHLAELRDGDWSFRSLVNASHLGDPRRRVQMWWQKEADLYFFRPVAFACLRVVYVLGGWRPEAAHIASLAWGVVCSSLVFVLGWRSTGRFGWGLLAAVLFLLHPNNSGTPRWIACQNEQMATAFTLAALLAYGRGAGWWSEGNVKFEMLNVKLKSARGGSFVWLGVTVGCYVAALGCRESAILMPLIFFVGDFVHRAGRAGRRDWVRMVSPYALFAAIALVYLLVRYHMLGPVTIPGRPYAWPPNEPGFIAFAVEKFIYYILGLWAFLPIIGFAGQEALRARPEIFGTLFVAIVVGWVVVLRLVQPQTSGHVRWVPPAYSRRVWLWLAVALIPLGPVLPVFAASHHLYLASAGMAIATVVALRALLDRAAYRRTAMTRVVRGMAIALQPVLLVVFIGANYATDEGMAGLSAACQLTPAQVDRFARPLKPDDKLFFINLPMLAFNCMPAIEEARGVVPLHGYVLTFAPKFVCMDRPAHVEQVGPSQLRVSLNEPGYFSGSIGRYILEGIDRERPFAPGETFATPDFEVRIERADHSGVQELLFTFQRPLTDPRYHFLVGSPVFDAYPRSFR